MRVFILLLSCLLPLSAFCQEEDISVKKGTLFLMPVKSINWRGEGNIQEWDFDFSTNKRKGKQLNYIQYGDSLLITYDSKCIKHFQGVYGNWYLSSYETPQVILNYNDSLLIWKKNLVEGDSIYTSYTSSGKFCGKQNMFAQGNHIIEYDGSGRIIENNHDTINNVVLMHAITTSSVNLNAKDCTNNLDVDEKDLLQKIEETYYWIYSPTNTPLFEYKIESFYKGLSLLATNYNTSKFEYISPDLTEDEATDEDTKAVQNSEGEKIIDYSIRQSPSSVTIDYCVTENADVRALLCSSTGILYFKESRKNKAGDSGSISFNISSLWHGNYVIYINVNGVIYSNTIRV